MDGVTEDTAYSIHKGYRIGHETSIERIIPETVDGNTIDTVMNSADKKNFRAPKCHSSSGHFLTQN